MIQQVRLSLHRTGRAGQGISSLRFCFHHREPQYTFPYTHRSVP